MTNSSEFNEREFNDGEFNNNDQPTPGTGTPVFTGSFNAVWSAGMGGGVM